MNTSTFASLLPEDRSGQTDCPVTPSSPSWPQTSCLEIKRLNCTTLEQKLPDNRCRVAPPFLDTARWVIREFRGSSVQRFIGLISGAGRRLMDPAAGHTAEMTSGIDLSRSDFKYLVNSKKHTPWGKPYTYKRDVTMRSCSISPVDEVLHHSFTIDV